MFKIKFKGKYGRLYFGVKRNWKGEKMDVYFHKINYNGKNIWEVLTLVSDLTGRDPEHNDYNPTKDGSDEWVLEATEENAEKILKEIERRFFPDKEDITESLIKGAGIDTPIKRVQR